TMAVFSVMNPAPAEAQPRIISAQEFDLVDANSNRVKASLGFSDRGGDVFLDLQDNQGQQKVRLYLDRDGNGGLLFADSSGNLRLGIGLTAPDQDPAISLRDNQQQTVWSAP